MTLRAFCLLILAAGLAGPARAATAPAEEAEKPKCVTSSGGFRDNNTFVIALTNACEQRVRCSISAYVTTAGGPTTGKGVLVLAPKSHGAAAHKTYIMKVKGAGGMAQMSHQCKGR